jgi:hypothetical protein
MTRGPHHQTGRGSGGGATRPPYTDGGWPAQDFPRPPESLGPGETRVLLALVLVYGRDGRATVRSVGAAAGLRSVNTAHKYLLRLRELDLATWTEGRVGTLRPTVAVAALATGTHPG